MRDAAPEMCLNDQPRARGQDAPSAGVAERYPNVGTPPRQQTMPEDALPRPRTPGGRTFTLCLS